MSIKIALDKRAQKTNVSMNNENLMKILSMGTELTRPFEYLLATGNLRSKTGKIKQIGRPFLFSNYLPILDRYYIN